MSLMKCVCLVEPQRVSIIEKDIPRPMKGEALLQILYGGICGSDLNNYKGNLVYSTFPRIPGHEFSARVIEVDENDCGIKVGMIVTGNPYYNCGECYSCVRDFVNCCMSNQTLGVQRDGVFQEYFCMPVERIYPAEGLSGIDLALVEPFCISYHAVKLANVTKKDSVLVIGAGTIGLGALMTAKQRGAITAVADISDLRLARARELGADTVFNTARMEVSEITRMATQGNGFDVVIECVGLPETFLSSIEAAAYRGRAVIVGVGKASADFNFTKLQAKELLVCGSRNALKEDFMEMIEIIRHGKIEVSRLVTNIYPMSESARAFKDLNNNQDFMLKVLLDFTK